MIMTVYIFSWWELALRIRDGSITTDLCARSTLSGTGSPTTSAGRRTTFCSGGFRRSSLGALVFDLHWPSPLDALAFIVDPHPRRRRQLRVPLHLQLGRVLAARLSRRRDPLDDDRHLLLRDGDPAPLLPDLLRDHLLCAAVRVGDPDTDRHLARQATALDARRRARAAARLGTRAARPRARSCSRARRESSWCRVVEPSSSGAGSSGAQIRSQLQYRASFALDVCRLVRDLVHRLPRHPDDLSQRLPARDVERARGRVPLRALVDHVRVHRPADRTPRSVPTEDPRRHLRHRARAAARHAVPDRRFRLRGPPLAQGAPGRDRARLRPLDLDSTGRPARRRAPRLAPERGRHLLVDLGRRRVHRVLDDRRRRVHERVHLRRHVDGAVPVRYLLDLAAAPARLRRPARVRLLLPGALRARQARPARPAALPRFCSPVVAASRRSSPGSSGGSRSVTTGAPADDRGRGPAQGVRRASRAPAARASRRRGRQRHLVPRRAR